MFPSATVLFNFLNRRNETTSSKQLRPKTHTVTETQEHTLAPSAFIPVCFHHISCLPSLYMKAHSQSLCHRKLAHTVSFPVTVYLYFSPLSCCVIISLSPSWPWRRWVSVSHSYSAPPLPLVRRRTFQQLTARSLTTFCPSRRGGTRRHLSDGKRDEDPTSVPAGCSYFSHTLLCFLDTEND